MPLLQILQRRQLLRRAVQQEAPPQEALPAQVSQVPEMPQTQEAQEAPEALPPPEEMSVRVKLVLGGGDGVEQRG